MRMLSCRHLFQVIYKSHEQLNRYVFKRHLTDCKEKNAADRGLPNSGEWSGSDSTFLAADVHRLCKPRCDRQWSVNSVGVLMASCESPCRAISVATIWLAADTEPYSGQNGVPSRSELVSDEVVGKNPQLENPASIRKQNVTLQQNGKLKIIHKILTEMPKDYA